MQRVVSRVFAPPLHADSFTMAVCSGSPADAEHKTYEMYLDYVRGTVTSTTGERRKEALGFLRKAHRTLMGLVLSRAVFSCHSLAPTVANTISSAPYLGIPLPRSALHQEEGRHQRCSLQGHPQTHRSLVTLPRWWFPRSLRPNSGRARASRPPRRPSLPIRLGSRTSRPRGHAG